jgi:hypothetical protein
VDIKGEERGADRQDGRQAGRHHKLGRHAPHVYTPKQLSLPFFFFNSAERSRYGTDVMARNRFTDGLVLSLIIFVR